MRPKPLYEDRNVEPAYPLRYDWTGWPSGEARLPSNTGEIIAGLREAWETDGIRVIESAWLDKRVQVLCSVRPTEERFRIADALWLGRIRDQSSRIAQKKGHAISRLSAMPDHLHLALRGNVDQSPQDIALAFQNNLAYALGQCRVWRDTYYVGTFSEYDMGAIRRSVRKRDEERVP